MERHAAAGQLVEQDEQVAGGAANPVGPEFPNVSPAPKVSYFRRSDG